MITAQLLELDNLDEKVGAMEFTLDKLCRIDNTDFSGITDNLRHTLR